VAADPAQFNKLLLSIMGRADQGGGKREIILRTERLMLSDPLARAAGNAPTGRDFVRLSLKDTAYGANKEQVNHILEPYFDSRSMDLAIAYGIARQHNGWIDVIGDEAGLTFEIYLPAAEKPGPREETKALEPAKPKPHRTLRVLLAEDDDDLRALTARTLRKNGHQVFEAGCAEKALEIFASQRGAFDTLVSDVVMPDKSGVTLADEVRKIKPEIDVILMSGYIDDKVHIDTIRTKGYKFIYKPFDVDALLIMLR
jgi:CheY-like chemotaxis protein